MEKEAHDRDQIHWACSAQDSKLLPKKKGKGAQEATKAQMRTRVNREFEAYDKQEEE